MVAVVQSMIVNATDRDSQGLVQGTTECLSTLARALGSLMFDVVHIPGSDMPVFGVLGVFYLISMIIACTMTKETVDDCH
jgi:hypothetical protein